MTELEFGKSPVEPSFWFLKAALYHSEDYRFDKCRGYGFDIFRDNIISVIFPRITIDVFCLSCKRETVFNPVEREIDWINNERAPIIKDGVQYAHFRCTRRHCRSNLYFVFCIFGEVVTKIGQFPSIADLLSPEIKKYSVVLEPNLISDWQRAIGLRAHGIGAGSFVYLRRIIEHMVNIAVEQALKDSKLNKEQYLRSRWPEKIKMLSEYLPNYLVENAKVYSILSKGVHELSEEECLDFFDVIQTSIEIICEEKLVEMERKRKSKTGAKALQKVFQRISGRPNGKNVS